MTATRSSASLSLNIVTFAGIVAAGGAIAFLLIGFLQESSTAAVGGSGLWLPILVGGFALAVVAVVLAFALTIWSG